MRTVRLLLPRGEGANIPLWVVVLAALIPVILLGGWLAADALQPHTYDPVRQTISVTAGHGATDRWVMTGALIAVSFGYLGLGVGALGLGIRARLGMIIAAGAGLGIAFNPQPATGTTAEHAAFAAVGAVAISIWPLITVRRSGRWPTSKRVALPVGGLFVALLLWTAVETYGGDLLGAAERACATAAACWPFVVAFGHWRASRPERAGRAGLAETAARIGDEVTDRLGGGSRTA